MIFYHGSKQEISKIIPHGSDPQNDYGPSFYTTLDLDSAKEWACKNEEAGIVNKYRIPKDNFDSLKILDLTNTNVFSVLNWLAILLHFRELDNPFKTTFASRLEWLSHYYIDVTQFDVIKGFRADDSYFAFPLKFIAGLLSLENLQKVFKLGNLGVQYAFMSEKAIKKLRFISSEKVDDKYVGKYYQIVKQATNKFHEIINKPIDDGETLITSLMKNYE